MIRIFRFMALAAALLLAPAVSLPAAAQTFSEAMAAYRAGDYDTAYKAFRTLAERGHAAAQSSFGDMHRKGYGTPQDYSEAAKWYRRAADRGDAYAQSSLGLLYREGHGVPRDLERAYMWFDRAARNFPASRSKMRDRAARNRDSIAASLTPEALARARDMAQAPQTGAAIDDAAPASPPPGSNPAGGQEPATFSEAMAAYRAGDCDTAYKAFRTLAERGHAAAQSSLGDMHRKGYGTPQDYIEAAKWYRCGADRGDAHGQSSLGLMYREGYGVPRDLERAYMWFDLAARTFPASRSQSRDRAARNRDRIAESLSPEALARAREMAPASPPPGSCPAGEQDRTPSPAQDQAPWPETILVAVLAILAAAVLLFFWKRGRARKARGAPGNEAAGPAKPAPPTTKSPSSTPERESVIAGKAYVTDGDGIRVSGQKIRLAYLDAPEWDQWAKHSDGYWFKHGKRVKSALIGKIGGQYVEVTVVTFDHRYDRIIGVVTCDGEDIGAWLVRNGHAIAAYGRRYREVECEARREKRGLWGYDVAFDPRDWRRMQARRR